MAAPVPALTSTSSLPTTINIRETPAVVEWTAQAGQDNQTDVDTETDTAAPCHLARSSNSSPITFNLFFDSSSNAAFFRLRATIVVHDSSRDKIQISAFLFIYPENVASLVHHQSSALSPEVAAAASKKLSGRRTTCLRFDLSKPASLVAPIHLPLAPRSKKDAQVLRSLQMLSNATALTVHFSHEALPTPELISLVCNAAAINSLKSSVNHGDLSQLYGGQGGKVIEYMSQDWLVPLVKDEYEASALETSAESPPSYDELVPKPPPSLEPVRSLKRPRTSSGYAEGELVPQDVMGICRKAVAEQMALIRGGLRDDIRREVKTQLEELENGLMERIDKRLAEQITELREDLTEQADRTEDRIDEVERHMDDLIDEGIEDRVLGVKIDMRDFVKDEMANVEDKIIEHFEDGRISLQFER